MVMMITKAPQNAKPYKQEATDFMKENLLLLLIDHRLWMKYAEKIYHLRKSMINIVLIKPNHLKRVLDSLKVNSNNRKEDQSLKKKESHLLLSSQDSTQVVRKIQNTMMRARMMRVTRMAWIKIFKRNLKELRIISKTQAAPCRTKRRASQS